MEEAAAALRKCGVAEVTGDRFGGEWPREAFRAHGIGCVVAERPQSDVYLSLLPVVNAGPLELLDVPRAGLRGRHPESIK